MEELRGTVIVTTPTVLADIFRKSYIEFIAAVIGLNTLLYLLLAGFQTYIDFIGLLALGLESTVSLNTSYTLASLS